MVRSQLDVFKEQSPALVQEPLPASIRVTPCETSREIIALTVRTGARVPQLHI